MKRDSHVGVIGGGIAGLTAAYRLASAGYRVSLWEKGPRFGGQAAAFPVSENHLEYFYHHLFQSDREIVDLIEEIGIGDRLLWLPSNVGYFANGKIYPLNGAKDLLKLDFLPLHDRLRIGLVTAYLQRTTDYAKFESVTAATWLRKALGSNAYDRTWGAQLKAKFGQYHEDVAMVWFWGKIWLRTTSRKSPLDQERLGYIDGSFNVLIDTIASAATAKGALLVSGSGPQQVSPIANGRWSLDFGGDHPAVECDAVIATTPSHVFSALVPDLPSDYRSNLHALIYEPAIVVLLEMDQPLTNIYWLNIADADVPFTGVIEHTNFMSPESYGGKHYVYLSKYLEVTHPYFSYSDDELLTTYLPFMRRLNPAFDPSWVVRSWVFRERAAQPIVTLNYRDKIPAHRTPLSGLYLANTSQIYPEDRGTNYSVRLGNQIAEMVSSDLARARQQPS